MSEYEKIGMSAFEKLGHSTVSTPDCNEAGECAVISANAGVNNVILTQGEKRLKFTPRETGAQVDSPSKDIQTR